MPSSFGTNNFFKKAILETISPIILSDFTTNLLDVTIDFFCAQEQKLCTSGDWNGPTTFNYAAHYGQLDICQHIIRNIIDKNPRALDGDTPLHCAAEQGDFDVCKFILNNISEKNPKGHRGETPLHLAVVGGHLNICKLILANIDDIDPKNLEGKTPMDIAKERNQIYILQLFRLAAIWLQRSKVVFVVFMGLENKTFSIE